MNRSLKPRYSRGLSLVELMVALVLSLVIGAAVLQMFLASKTTYSLQNAMARVQENGRFAVSFLASDIRMAGFMGCGNLNEITINVIANPAPIDAANPLGQIIGGQITWVQAMHGMPLQAAMCCLFAEPQVLGLSSSGIWPQIMQISRLQTIV